MGVPAERKATYEDLRKVPETMVAEIVDGELHAVPRPWPRHAKAASDMGNATRQKSPIEKPEPGSFREIRKEAK